GAHPGALGAGRRGLARRRRRARARRAADARERPGAVPDAEHRPGLTLRSAPILPILLVAGRGRGGGAGWLMCGRAWQKPSRRSAAALAVEEVDVETRAGRPPTNRIVYPLPVPLADAPPARFVSAAPDSGMGSFRILPRVALVLPADACPTGCALELAVSVAA